MKRTIDVMLLTGWMLALGLVVTFDAEALTHDIKWTHPEPDRLTWVFVIADGQNVAEQPVPPPDADGVITTTVVVPFGADVQIQVQDSAGMTSELSNFQVYGDQCSDFDADGDGFIGQEDFNWFKSEWRNQSATMLEFGMFRSVYGDFCS
jgi:hypothetical protein